MKATFRQRAPITTPLMALLLGVFCTAPASAMVFPVFDGDPVDSSSGRAFEILPGLPLILPQPDGKFDPPVIDTTTSGDVDLVVRTGTPMVGPEIPAPAVTPPAGVAGTLLSGGAEIPFTVIVSDGATTSATGNPLFGPEMDGIPVVVTAYVDIDGDGFVGPTNDDAEGASDNIRELQESDFIVGRQVALFDGGIATGSIAVRKAAPGSTGGMAVVLGAVAYVGPFDLGFFAGNVPDGPGVATLLPFFPRLDPGKVVDGDGKGGAAGPSVRLGFEFEPVFDTLDALALGLPLALPTDASGVTTDRGVVSSGAFSRARFLEPSSPVNFPLGMEVPLFRGAGGVLYEPLPAVDVVDDGPGAPTNVRLFPVDLMDNITDPPPGATATLIAGAGLKITSPDTDQDPSRETVPITGAAGVEISIDDVGGVNDSGTTSSVWIVVDGFPVETLDVNFTAGGVGPGPQELEIRNAHFEGHPTAFVAGCSTREELFVTILNQERDTKKVSGTILLDNMSIGKLNLKKGFQVPPNQSNVTETFFGRVQIRPRTTGLLEIILTAVDSAKNLSDPFSLLFPVVKNQPPSISEETLSMTELTLGSGEVIVASARVSDDCRVSRVSVEVDTGRGFRRAGSLKDDGRKSDLVAGDGIFTGPVKLKTKTVGVFPVQFVASDRLRATAVSPATDIQVVAP